MNFIMNARSPTSILRRQDICGRKSYALDIPIQLVFPRSKNVVPCERLELPMFVFRLTRAVLSPLSQHGIISYKSIYKTKYLILRDIS